MSFFQRISQFVSTHRLKIGAAGVGLLLGVAALLGAPAFAITASVMAIGAGVTAWIRKRKGVQDPYDPGSLMVGGTLAGAFLVITIGGTVGISFLGVATAGAIPLQASAEADRELQRAPSTTSRSSTPDAFDSRPARAPRRLSSKLREPSAKAAKPLPLLGLERPAVLPPTLRYGGADDPDWIRRAQRALAKLGFDPANAQPGSFDSDTWRMVREFQREAGLPVSGILDSRTWTALQSHLRKAKEGESELAHANSGGLRSALREAAR